MTIMERFGSQVDSSGGPESCWPFLGGHSNGYGRFTIFRRKYQAPRIAYLLFVGGIPCGHQVLHRCDNPPCCNPAHLFTGTNLDNYVDSVQKGRRSHLVFCWLKPGPKVIDGVDARLIKWAIADGMSQRKIGKSFGISHVMVGHIKRGRNWKGVSL